MSAPFQIQRRVEFSETDAAGIAHFSVFFLYMEQAEHALLRHLGLSVMRSDEDAVIGWPRVSAQCDFSSSVQFEDILDVAVCVEKLGKRSVTYGIEFTHDGQKIASGKMTSVCCRIEPEKPPRSIPIPEPFVERLRQFTPGHDR